MAVNIKLKTIREKNKLSHNDMALKLNISKGYYWQIENGRRNIYYKLAIQIADIFFKKPDELFYDYLKNK